MIDLNNIISFIINSNSGIELSNEEKEIISLWFDDSIYRDKELIRDIQAYRNGNWGSQEISPGEVGRLLKAFRSPQYRNFILHLFHSYSDPKKVHPLDGNDECNCSICGNILYKYQKWKCNDSAMALISTESGLPICKNCLMQLNYAKTILFGIGQLDWYNNNN